MNIMQTMTSLSHTTFLWFAGLIGLAFLVFIHECGHFLMCKVFGVRTPSFSIGFGKPLISKKIGDTVFSISAIPLGGYVEIAGNAEIGQGDQKEAHSMDAHSFAVKPFYQKFLIMIGGILCNLLFAYLVAIFVFSRGTPKSMLVFPYNTTPEIETVMTGSPAEKAGLRPGDKILSIDGVRPQSDAQPLLSYIATHPGKTVACLIDRSGEQIGITVTLHQQAVFGKAQGMMGIVPKTTEKSGLPCLQAIKTGIAYTNKFIVETLSMFKYIWKSRDMSNIGGPLMIMKVSAASASSGFSVFLLLLAIISINLAILNLLPLPIFDGGQILIYGIEALIGRSLPLAVRAGINIVSWGLMMLLFVAVTIKDIWCIIGKFFSGH